MIEIYLFVHPLCTESLAAEKVVLDFVEQADLNIQFKFIPLLNLQSFQSFVDQHPNVCPSFKKRNKLFEAAFSSALDFKAMQLQGKKKGREFLLKLQETLLDDGDCYSKDMVEQTILTINGNLDLFYEDRQTFAVRDSFKQDQEIAKEMGVTKASTLVFFNYTYNQDFGISVHDELSVDLLFELLSFTPERVNEFDIHAQTVSIETKDNEERPFRLVPK
ncbi:DsbA family protein [Vagococcus coleopterorum]|uniref:DsbA family protein n=1 Tax=Vagococcus coleopterorum TaxID=2714946 RepID=A0A6G8AKY5_9ENTE|nr:DsbA family protein [Vagococcus coleopterorum]QIL45731.1 DsbA family protein [Vagococcus coleopterorum]